MTAWLSSGKLQFVAACFWHRLIPSPPLEGFGEGAKPDRHKPSPRPFQKEDGDRF